MRSKLDSSDGIAAVQFSHHFFDLCLYAIVAVEWSDPCATAIMGCEEDLFAAYHDETWVAAVSADEIFDVSSFQFIVSEYDIAA